MDKNKRIGNCQEYSQAKLWLVNRKLRSLAELIRNYDNEELGEPRFFGLGVMIGELADEIKEIQEMVERLLP